ncbi:MAG: TIGR00180 family glycosyltransferase [Humidesulfovibrio sp.]|nr:TIGR00180 family glycosyltransferase [Humidesulfovibrio sp.]
MQTLPLTIVIPTYQRHHLLGRALAHYDAFGLPVIVVDSTPEPFTDLGNLRNVEYLHRPDAPMPHKLRAPVLENVRTPYMVMSADDSFTSLSGLRSCVEFLAANEDYSSAQGYYFGYWLRGDEVALDLYYRSVETLDSLVDSHRPEDRLIQMFSRYSAMFYAVYRTDCQREMLQRFPDMIRNYCIAEFYFAMMTALHGKHALLPVFYQLQEHAPGIGHNETFRNDMHRLATKPRYIGEFDAFVDAVAAYLAERSGRPLADARIFIMKAVALQAWQRKMEKNPGDRLRTEWQALLNKTVFKARKREITRLKRKAEAAQLQLAVDGARALIGPEGRAELDGMVRSLGAQTSAQEAS